MKISFRLLFINFIIVLLILGSSGFAFYSILNNIITSQQSKHLLNSANSFVYQLESSFQDIDREFFLVYQKNKDFDFNKNQFVVSNIDFIFKLSPDSIISSSDGYFSHSINLSGEKIHLADFIRNNPFVIIKKFVLGNGVSVFYGRLINTDYLNSFYTRLNNDIAVALDNKTIITSNESTNQNLAFFLTEASKELSKKNNFDIFTKTSETADLYATIYRPKSNFIPANINFLVFSRLNESVELRSNLKYILSVLGFAGIALSLILTLIFTERIRKQIETLNEATEITKTGNFHNRIDIRSKDELGLLASAFNTMLDELEKKNKINNEYSEFIALINQNPTLHQVAENALNKIIKTGGFNIGAIYNIENDDIILASSYGLQNDLYISKDKANLFEPVMKRQETLELNFEDKPQKINSGSFAVDIMHLLVIPIIYNSKVIALLELGSVKKASAAAIDYIAKIKEQLAIGLTNATALVQLENLVTELKKLNEDYQKQNLQVKEQNAALLELHNNLQEKAEELEIQKIKAEEVTKLKSQFLASMSHELRTPLNSIIGLTELALDDKNIIGKSKDRISVVLRNSQRLMKLINDILDLSKVESGKMEIIDEVVQLEDIISEIRESINLLAVNKNLLFRMQRNCDTAIYIKTDRAKILQVLTNLLSNAIKFTDKGSVTLEVSVTEERQLLFNIIDSGIGISVEDQKIIFDEFRQVDGTSTRKYSGTGLGLTICKKIAVLLKGDIIVNSRIGRGSTFSFSIPLVEIAAPANKPERAPEQTTFTKTNPNLVVSLESDFDIQSIFEQYFNSKGFDVEFEDNSKAGIEKSEALTPSMITLNPLLPNINFFDTLYSLKTNSSTKNIPLLITAIDPVKNIGYGFNVFDFIIHPLTRHNFASSLGRLEIILNKKIERVLIFEDSVSYYNDLTAAINKKGISFSNIASRDFSVEKIKEINPDFILTNLLFDDTDGLVLSAFIQSYLGIKNIPVIIYLDGIASDEQKEKLVQSCADIAVKYKYHPLDVLKTIRNRIRIIEELEIPELKEDHHSDNAYIDDEDEERSSNFLGEVLIVDDDPDTLYTISEIVNECNCKTILANNGIECLNVLNNRTPDLILLDIMMPVMDGFQTIKKIKANSKWANIPVYAVTAKAMLGDKQVILNQGFDDYITKPVSSSALAFKIQKTISNSKDNKL